MNPTPLDALPERILGPHSPRGPPLIKYRPSSWRLTVTVLKSTTLVTIASIPSFKPTTLSVSALFFFNFSFQLLKCPTFRDATERFHKLELVVG
jgi:hypothetical protein